MQRAEQTDRVTMAESGRAAGERALLRAILEDARHCVAGAIGPVPERSQLALEAAAWIRDRDLRWPFSFENVCGYLGFDPDRLRSQLLGGARELPATDQRQPPRSGGRGQRETPVAHEIMEMIRAGRPLRVVAKKFRISISTVSIRSRSLASRIRGVRDTEIRRLRSAGWTHRALAERFGLSRVRIIRICVRQTVGEHRTAEAQVFAPRGKGSLCVRGPVDPNLRISAAGDPCSTGGLSPEENYRHGAPAC